MPSGAIIPSPASSRFYRGAAGNAKLVPMNAVHANRFGRRPGRGLRPWLLLPKVIAVAIYFGGLGTTTIIWWINGLEELNAADPKRGWLIVLTSRLMVFWILPAMLTAMALGAALLLQHSREFIRMGWLRLKLLILVLFIPPPHLFLSTRLHLLRAAFNKTTINEAAQTQFRWGLLAALVVSLLVVVLGRLKPQIRIKNAGILKG